MLAVTTLMCAAAHAFAGGDAGQEESRRTYQERRIERIEDPARSGPYLHLGVAYAFEDFAMHDVTGEWDDAWGYDVRGGYRSHSWLATEVQWQHLPSFAGPGSQRARGRSEADVETSILSFNGKLYPLGGRVQPFVLAGAGWQSAEQRGGLEEDALALRFGAGVDVYFTSNVGMAVEGGYVWPVSSQLADAEEVNIIPVNASIFLRFM
ncbi:MAG TPA: outer membrane beta-barrel protein [Candidatus Binatia bacterium]|nr:outer membrane beta-barrel protein [Candidatus Binatia bacterium]